MVKANKDLTPAMLPETSMTIMKRSLLDFTTLNIGVVSVIDWLGGFAPSLKSSEFIMTSQVL